MEKSEYASSHRERQTAVPSPQARRDIDDDEVYSLQEQKRIIRRMLVQVSSPGKLNFLFSLVSGS
ncbi:hypothetical protein VCV18_007177 [Metarhizium anisopliae]